MRTISTNVYTYDELSEQAQGNARDWLRGLAFSDNNDWGHVYDDADTVAQMLGIEIARRPAQTYGGQTVQALCIYFSGFSSQGDGAHFTGRYERHYTPDSAGKKVREYAPTDETLHEIADNLDTWHAENGGIAVDIEARGREVHSGVMSLGDWYADKDEGFSDGEPAHLLDILRRFADWIYSQLEQEYEYQTSDEQLAETIRANGYEFTANGKIV